MPDQAAPNTPGQSRPRLDALGVRTTNARPQITKAGILQDRLLGVRTPLPHTDEGVPRIKYGFGSNHEVRLAFTSKHVGLSATQGVGSPGQGSLGGG